MLKLPPSLAVWLGEHGVSATPVRDAGLRESDDRSIWHFARTGGWTVITKDEDFVSLCLNETDSPAVVWLRIGNATNRVLFACWSLCGQELSGCLKTGTGLWRCVDRERTSTFRITVAHNLLEQRTLELLVEQSSVRGNK
jgi:predicted nuclease of predicted toxin-antitoxin system